MIVINKKNCVTEGRLGRFRISRKMMEQHPHLIKRIMGKCVIMACVSSLVTNAVEYEAYCDDFPENNHYCFPPLYNIVVTENENGSMDFEFQKDGETIDESRKPLVEEDIKRRVSFT